MTTLAESESSSGARRARRVAAWAAVRGFFGEYRGVRDRLRLRWWKELLIIGSFYLVYSMVRNQFGSAAVGWPEAYDNARAIIDIERAVGLYQEVRIQDWFIDWVPFIQFWNLFYGTFHFAVTAFVLFWLYVKFPWDYPRWRAVGLATTGLALVGFSLFPLMPPRLLGNCGVYGACLPDTGFIDTVTEVGGLWSFDSGAGQKLSNQYAAMPSMHFGWALWCFIILWPRLKNPIGRVLIALYPWLTLFAIVVTANHFWLDAVGGVLALALGYVLGSLYWELRSRQLGVEDLRAEPGSRPTGVHPTSRE
jgi:hypothetical protein